MDMIGNRKTAKLLERIADSGKIANAYLFLGPQGVGKFKAAMLFAKKMVGDKGGINPNLILIGPEIEEKNGIVKKKDIKIEAIRDLQHKLSLTSAGGGYKAVVINEAERLNLTSQSALLKTLEEPNKKVVIILVSHNEKKILATIVSRCQKIKLGLMSESEIRINVGNIGDVEEIVFWSAGRAEMAHSFLINAQELEYMREAKKGFLLILGGSIGEKFALAETWSKDVADLLKKMDIWMIFLRKAMLGEARIKNLSASRALRTIEEISTEIIKLRETNANAKLILENLFLKI
ncbi:MAG: hypothetical protein ACD_15C00073G0008 [uncultured bacterium]|nr:MAG: hypothetical protein ACD_15C00073G0008 [uncultured bacterium]HCU70615.1 hypothetical protein [Candidatus Moranbacteria bacterium]